MKTQLQIFYEEQRKIADINNMFLDAVEFGLNREGLARLIAHRPELWGRFENWHDKLPE